MKIQPPSSDRIEHVFALFHAQMTSGIIKQITLTISGVSTELRNQNV